jgi:hypothetical protein
MAVHGQTRMPNAPAVSTSFGSLPFIEFPFENKTLNCQLSTASKLLPSQAGWGPTASSANSREGQMYVLFPDKAEE